VRPLDPLRSEDAMFRVLLWVIAVAVVATAIVVVARAIF
jgi:hypothetical protein